MLTQWILALTARRAAAPWLPPVKTLIGFPLIYCAFAAISLGLNMEGVIPLWMASSILVVALIRSPLRHWPVLLALGWWADFAAGLLAGIPISSEVLLGTVNLFESLVIAEGLRRFAGNRPWYTSGRWMVVFPLLAIFGSAAVNSVGSAWIASSGDAPFLTVWRDWIASDGIGFMVGVPFLLSWTEPALRRDFSVRRTAEALVLSGVVAAVAYSSFTSSLPLLFMAFPLLALITLRAGLAGATTGAIAVAAVLLLATMNGEGPIAALPVTHSPLTDSFVRSLVLQAYFLTAALSTIPVAVFMTLREALLNQVRRQDAISSAALDNMIQGLCMFDSDRRLIISNRRYTELYSLPEADVVPGTSLSQLLDRQVAAGNYWGEPDEFISDCLREAGDLVPHREVELHDGRIIDIHRTPAEQGGWVETHEDVTEQRRAGHRIAYLATHDSLTDLANRASFNEHLERSLAIAQRGHGFALHCLDLDRFKAVNDTLGHGAGDELLRQVADRLREIGRGSDLVSRLGGDEFAIIQFPIDGPDDAGALAARLVELLGKPYHLDGQEAIIGASVGIVRAPIDAVDCKDLLQKGDLALYRAKDDGRNTFCFFEPGMDSVVHERRVMETELKAALAKGEFELFYQPVVNLETGSITSFEALLRWRHPIRGVIEPAEFIPLTEESGLIIPIGEWVLRHACREAATWPDDIKVSVNVSPVQFKNRKLAALVMSAVAAANIAPQRLELEITESLLLQDSEEVLKILHQLRDAGIGIAMDDFGTGYSSLSYLRSFPFDRIKIDRSFVRDVVSEEDCLAIVHATAQLSGKLGMRTTAEGVETAAQLNIMRAEGCTDVQGFFISEPVPAHAVRDLLGRGSRPGSRIARRVA